MRLTGTFPMLCAGAVCTGCADTGAERARAESSPLQERIVLLPGETQAVSGMPAGYSEDSAAVAAGKRLFAWYNCAGCHAPEGGGGMGPPLSDAEWIYGSHPTSVFETISRGRPKGMPAWGGVIPDRQILQLVAYARALSDLPASLRTPPSANAGEDTTDAEPGR